MPSSATIMLWSVIFFGLLVVLTSCTQKNVIISQKLMFSLLISVWSLLWFTILWVNVENPSRMYFTTALLIVFIDILLSILILTNELSFKPL
jgi:hypothetical protein